MFSWNRWTNLAKVKFSFFEKATKFWSYHPLDLTFTKKMSNQVGNNFKFLRPFQKHCISSKRAACYHFYKYSWCSELKKIYFKCKCTVPLAIRRTRITRMMVGLMGIKSDSNSSITIPTTERNTIPTSNWFHLKLW